MTEQSLEEQLDDAVAEGIMGFAGGALKPINYVRSKMLLQEIPDSTSKQYGERIGIGITSAAIIYAIFQQPVLVLAVGIGQGIHYFMRPTKE